MDAIISVRNLKKSFTTEEVLKGISFDVHKNEKIAIIGTSGCGKSTTLRCINLLEFPTDGEILFHGENILKLKNLNQYRAKVGMVFQNFNLFNNLTVLDNCVLGQMKVLKKSREEAVEEAKKQLGKVGMLNYAGQAVTTLSGGQKQRVAIAAVLAMRHDIIVFDEATSMLDPTGKREINNLIKELHKDKKLTVISITHDIEEVAQSDNVIVVNKGKIALVGTPKEVFRNEKLMESMQLDIPFVYKVRNALKKKGVRVSDELDMERMAEEVCRYVLKK